MCVKRRVYRTGEARLEGDGVQDRRHPTFVEQVRGSEGSPPAACARQPGRLLRGHHDKLNPTPSILRKQ